MKNIFRNLIFAFSLYLISCNYSIELQNISENNFESIVQNSEYVWVIKIASKFCGSCEDFSPIFNSVTMKLTNLKYGIVYVDNTEGYNLASKLDVLNSGLPAVLIFKNNGEQSFKQIVTGDVISEIKLTEYIIREVSHLNTENGFYLKQNKNIDL